MLRQRFRSAITVTLLRKTVPSISIRRRQRTTATRLFRLSGPISTPATCRWWQKVALDRFLASLVKPWSILQLGTTLTLYETWVVAFAGPTSREVDKQP